MIERRDDTEAPPLEAHKADQFLCVQILRFVAASSVVAFHAYGTALKYLPGQNAHVGSLFRYGDHGVDIFFVISGFIICYSTYFTKTNWLTFLSRRLQRIVPTYWLYTLAMVVLAFVVPRAFSDTDWINLQSVVLSMTFLSFTQEKMPIVFVGWSLEYEMLFYLTVTILLFRAQKVWDDLIVIFSVLTILSNLPARPSLQAFDVFFTNPILLEFVYGVIVAKLFLRQRVTPLAMAAVSVATFISFVSDPTSRVIVAGLPSCALVMVAAVLSRRQRQPSTAERILGVLGDASYSIYLVHVFVISAVLKLLVKIGALPIDLAILVAMLCAILAGYCSYVCLERPSLQFFRRLRTSRQAFISPAASKPS
jgi:exopolysaccharide production protein ExoZ